MIKKPNTAPLADAQTQLAGQPAADPAAAASPDAVAEPQAPVEPAPPPQGADAPATEGAAPQDAIIGKPDPASAARAIAGEPLSQEQMLALAKLAIIRKQLQRLREDPAGVAVEMPWIQERVKAWEDAKRTGDETAIGKAYKHLLRGIESEQKRRGIPDDQQTAIPREWLEALLRDMYFKTEPKEWVHRYRDVLDQHAEYADHIRRQLDPLVPRALVEAANSPSRLVGELMWQQTIAKAKTADLLPEVAQRVRSDLPRTTPLEGSAPSMHGASSFCSARASELDKALHEAAKHLTFFENMSIAQSDTVKKIRELNDELRQIEHEIDEIERRGLGDLPIDRVPTPTESLGMTLLKKVAAFYVVEALKRFSRDIEEKKYYDRIKLLLHKQQLLLDELAYYQRALRESIPPYQIARTRAYRIRDEMARAGCSLNEGQRAKLPAY